MGVLINVPFKAHLFNVFTKQRTETDVKRAKMKRRCVDSLKIS